MGAPLLAAGGIAGAAGSIQQGYAASGAASYNAKIAQENAALATQNAAWTGAEGEQAYGIAGQKARLAGGSIEAAQAANNVDVTTGSARMVQRSEAEGAALSQANIRSNAARQAYGFETQAVSDTAQAALLKSQAKQDIAAGFTGAGTSIARAGGTATLYDQGSGTPTGETSSFSQGTVAPSNATKAFLSSMPEDQFNLWQQTGNSTNNLFAGP